MLNQKSKVGAIREIHLKHLVLIIVGKVRTSSLKYMLTVPKHGQTYLWFKINHICSIACKSSKDTAVKGDTREK